VRDASLDRLQWLHAVRDLLYYAVVSAFVPAVQEFMLAVHAIEPWTSGMADELSEERIAIRNMALAFAAEKMAPFAEEWDRCKTLPVETLREAAALGLGGITVRENSGGSGLKQLDAALIFEALATGCPTVSAFLSIHNMAAWMVDSFGSEELRATVLPDLLSMHRIASYCLTEPGAGSDAAALTTSARCEGDTYVVNGTKQFISGAGLSDWYVTMVRTGGEGPSGITALAIPGSASGIKFGAHERKMGWNAQPTAQVVFENCRVPVGHRLGAEGEGFAIAMKGLDGGRLNIGACSLGGAQAALDKTLAYMAERKAFGRSIDQFQALQFRLADMETELVAARALLHLAARRLDVGDPDATRLVAMAKRFATDIGFKVADEALQLHGGYGYLSAYGIEKIVRDLRVHRILEGTNEILRLIIARGLVRKER
jgi:alkylation response protein AidB-like acyl-CoA dehydrogenase